MVKSMKLRKLTAWMATLLLVFSFVTPVQANAAEGAVSLQILATSDTHGKFAPYDYALNTPATGGSLEQAYTLIKQLKGQNPNTILVDAGDIIQDNSADIFLNDTIHPMIDAMNQMGYDAITLGNHEFNYGVPTLQKVMGKSTAAVLCGNVYDSNKNLLYKPYTIVEKGGVKVGIIGMTSQNINRWDSTNLANYTVTVPVEETKKAIQELKGKVDVIIAVEHMSEGPEYGTEGSDIVALANACPELTAIVAAHEHKMVGDKAKQVNYNGTKMVENKAGASTVAQININLTLKDGKYVVNDKLNDVQTDVISTATLTADPDLAAKLASYDQKAKDDANTVIGKLTGGDLVPASEVTGIPTAQIQQTSMIDLINEVQMYYGKADIAAAAAFSDVANIKEGQVKKCDMSLIYKYANTLYTLQMTGKQLKQYMEWSAQYYNTYKPGDLTLSFNQNIRGYNYDMFSGVKYNVDVTKPVGQRIVNLTKMDGTPIKDTDSFKMAVNNYRCSSQLLSFGVKDAKTGVLSGPYLKENGDTLPTLLEKDLLGGTPIRDLIGKYITDVKKGTITNAVGDNWKVIGNNWDTTLRAQAVDLINSGKLSLPKSADGRTPNVAAVTKADVLKAAAAKKIDIISINDFHGTLLEDTSSSGKNPGIAKLASAINAYKVANPNTVLVSGGDLYQGSALSNLTYGAPVSEALKSMGVIASAIGNHEFDWGIDRVTGWAKDGGFTFLASNIYDTTTGKPVTYAKPYLVTTVNGVKIGFIGLSTPETMYKTTAANVKNVEFRDPSVAASEWAGKLKDGSLPEGKVDVVIALTHLGSVQDANGVITGEAADLCNKATNVDAVISAHTHMPVAGYVNNIPVVQGYYNGRTLADLTLCFDNSGKLTGIAPSIDNLYTRKATITEDPTVKAIVDKYNAKLSPIMNKVVGHTDVDLTHDKNQGMSVLGTWACELMRKQVGTQICINNGGGFRAPIAKGDITMGTLYTVFPFDNSLVTMDLKGSDIKRVIENGIGNTTVGWVQQSGLKITYDLTRPFGDRVTAMTLSDGTVIDPNKYYTVATNSFMYNVDNPAKGGDNYDFTGAKNVVDSGIQMRDALVMQLSGKATTGTTITLPKTGSPVDMGLLVSLGSMLSGAGAVLYLKGRKKDEDKAA